MSSSRIFSWASLLLVLSIPSAFAGTALSLGSASGYNVFVLGAYGTSGNTDIEGAAAVGGNFTSTGSLSFNDMPGSVTVSTPSLVVGGNLSLDGGQMYSPGNALVVGNVTSSSNFTFQHNLTYGTLGSDILVDGTKSNGASLPFSFSTVGTSLVQLSGTLNGLQANGTVAVSGPNYTLNATGCTLCVFDLTVGNYSNGAININAPTGATVVINVPGATDSFTNSSINYTGGATASDTLFNFDAATTLMTSGFTMYGSVLAPDAAFTGTSGSLNGELIAASVSGQSAEFESGDIFSGNLGTAPGVPEPSTWFLMGTALLACLALRTKRTATSNTTGA